MRILQAIDVEWFNACASFALQQAKGLQLLGHDVLLLADRGSPIVERARTEGIDVHEELKFGSPNPVATVFGLRDLARDFDAEFFIAHRGPSHSIGAFGLAGTSVRVARFRGDARLPRRHPLSRFVNEKLTHGVAVSTERLQEEYRARFELGGMPLEVLYPAIDAPRFQLEKSPRTLKRQFGLDPNRPVIGMIGRLSLIKGHRCFLKAARRVANEFPTAQWVIAGTELRMKRSDLEAQVAESRLDHVHFFDLVPRVEELIGAFDVGVVASEGSEMISRVLVEYFASGIASVATEINQVDEIARHSGAALRVPPGSPEKLGEAIGQLLESEELREALGTRGRAWASHRTFEQLGRETESFLDRIRLPS